MTSAVISNLSSVFTRASNSCARRTSCEESESEAVRYVRKIKWVYDQVRSWWGTMIQVQWWGLVAMCSQVRPLTSALWLSPPEARGAMLVLSAILSQGLFNKLFTRQGYSRGSLSSLQDFNSKAQRIKYEQKICPRAFLCSYCQSAFLSIICLPSWWPPEVSVVRTASTQTRSSTSETFVLMESASAVGHKNKIWIIYLDIWRHFTDNCLFPK